MGLSDNGNIVLSVCVVTYNHETYIEDCIKSILQQNINFRMEILVGNDCSNDDTEFVLKAYEDEVTIINREKNVGLCANLYDLLLKAKGKYVFTIAGDDFLCDFDILKKHVKFLEENQDFYMISGGNYLLNDKGELIKCHKDECLREYKLNDFLSNGNVVCAEGTMRNTFFEDRDKNKYLAKGALNNEEMKLWIYILTKGKVYVCQEPFYTYRYVICENASNYNSSHSNLDMFKDYYNDLLMLSKEFKGKYNFKPAIMHKSNEYCVKFSVNYLDILLFLRELRIIDIWNLLCYKIYLKTHNYKDPKRWKEIGYLINDIKEKKRG